MTGGLPGFEDVCVSTVGRPTLFILLYLGITSNLGRVLANRRYGLGL
jgi:hypothetical protein